MNLRHGLLTSACVLLALGASNAFGGLIFTATLEGSQEVPPVATEASGSATLELSDDESELSYRIEVLGLDLGGVYTPDSADDITGVHIHAAPVGANGSPVFGILNPSHDLDRDITIINGPPGPIIFEGKWDDADVGAESLASQLDALISGGLYINVHTEGNTGGEIRGQIGLIPEPTAVSLACLALLGAGVVARKRMV